MLVNYWKKKFNFSNEDYSVIPTTLNSLHLKILKKLKEKIWVMKKMT